MAYEVTPFRIEVPNADLEDLRVRLGRTRWPERETVEDWSQGIPLAYVRELCDYWRDGYDWRRAEAQLNSIGQFQTELDGLAIHFLHARSPHPNALPLLMTHGWPGSVVEFLKVIGPLVDPPAYGGDPADAFHLVCPSLPGYGFSDKPTEPGWDVQRIAASWAQLMARLGYGRYGAQGGDWGAAVSIALALLDPEHLVGVHTNFPIADPAALKELGELDEHEQEALASYAHHRRWNTGYSKQQSTRPQTLGYALVDSPVGLCAWIVEKFWAGTDCDGHPENALSRDELLDNVMLYWLPATAASSARLYWESFNTPCLRALGRHPLQRPAPFQPARSRRPLRRLRTTRPVHRRTADVLPSRPLISTTSSRSAGRGDSSTRSRRTSSPERFRTDERATVVDVSSGRPQRRRGDRRLEYVYTFRDGPAHCMPLTDATPAALTGHGRPSSARARDHLVSDRSSSVTCPR